MTRILYWNLQNFSYKRICDASSDEAFTESDDRLDYIINVIKAVRPQIIAIVEVFARSQGDSEQGVILPAHTKAAMAVLKLRDKFRSKLAETWCLVPPLTCGKYGKCEAVAVYYDAAMLRFTGPWVYVKGDIDISAPPGFLHNITDYPPAWRDGMPNPNNPVKELREGRDWTIKINGQDYKVNEYQSAGQWRYTRKGSGPVIGFPTAQDRSPFYTRLIEQAGGRVINLFTVHTSPDLASDAMLNITNIPKVSDPPPVMNVNVVVGDFNADSFIEYSKLDLHRNPYFYLRGMKGARLYTMLLDPCDDDDELVLNRQPYCLTHLLPNFVRSGSDEVAFAGPFNATGREGPDPQHNVYPRFGYMGSMARQSPPTAGDWAAIDNAFVRFGPQTPRPASHNTTIVNTVVGKPYDKLNPAPPGVGPELTGGLTLTSTLTRPVPLPGGIDPAGSVAGFNNWGNYGLIRGISDHLAIAFDV